MNKELVIMEMSNPKIQDKHMKALRWYEDNKKDIHTTKDEAVYLYFMGMDCRGIKPDKT